MSFRSRARITEVHSGPFSRLKPDLVTRGPDQIRIQTWNVSVSLNWATRCSLLAKGGGLLSLLTAGGDPLYVFDKGRFAECLETAKHSSVEERGMEADFEVLLRENAIFKGIPLNDLSDLTKHASVVELGVRAQIYSAEQPIENIYFPIDSVLSVVTQMHEGGVIEVGTIGREGCSGIPLLLGATTTANDCYCQVPGRAISIRAEPFHILREKLAAFRALLDRFLQAYVNFLGQLAGCNRLHTVYERTSRWLLMTHDRVGRYSIPLTHEYLAMMLGSRRSGVSIALATLKPAGYVNYSRGSIEILNRQGLEETTCECYAVAQKQFGAVFRAGSGSPGY